MKQDKGDKIIQKAELKAKKAAQQVQIASKKAEAAKQKQAAKAEKKAAQAAKNAEKKAAKHTKKAEQATKKAQQAAQKAQEKKAKAAAKTAAKAIEGEDGGAEESAGKKKKAKKKLLLVLIPVLAAAVGAGVLFFLKGGDKEPEEVLPEPISAPMEYVLAEGEVPITALPVTGDQVLVYREEIAPEPPEEPESTDNEEESQKNGEAEGDEGESAEEPAAEPAEEPVGFTKILYRYEGLKNPMGLISAYTALMTSEDAGFSVVDEELLRIDSPEFGTSGSAQIARNVPAAEDGTGGGVHSMLLSWGEDNCSVLLDKPEGRVRDPKPETPDAGPRRGLSDMEAIHPSKLGLEGESMDAYELIPQEGSVRIGGKACMRVNIYDGNSQIAGSYFLSSDGHLYKLDETVNAVVELEWE